MAMMRKTLTIILTVCLVSVCACAPKVVFHDPTEVVAKVRAGESYTPSVDGWFLSNAELEKLMLSVEYYREKWEACEKDR